MTERTPAEVFPPSDYIKEEMAERGWSASALAEGMDCSLRLAEEIINGRKVTLMIAQMLSNAFGTGAMFWVNLQNYYDKYKPLKE